ncbi:ImmA/IrrE family metallo-endopeptidase [Limosilactobacillus reuteri]|jgi:Zn-dependent peptidase ImmA (M78 family)|uniref:IrrE N-terminal-like domain-containing protein n=2 Tax=Limosilactobacillus reuteri TaxID=1598 RepID=A5VKM8_LIMRD|nr:ImmA/IrrE family metallo-endopeptidase [Limosilactobacillus reuteri]ABQ83402.1 protein of unknown function DUF955 [Limosilactobacillus reuteri subsp. reuteri]EEI10037.1 putative toxin-antitoxin system, toxin component [Limosilactobacillus reuteri MM2-3]EGC13990.1 putative toxin-antitoxin system, toxin component [Limosilactobacillus reuteri MM4-1A]EGC16037.1 putative toxin-antitoxin system, toxin component [Limosilactobacillus reuteri MM4-1A]KRK52307.1 hypothetical protein FC53_GL000007 [Lim
MRNADWIKQKALEVVYDAGTNNPMKICEENGIYVCHQDLGKAFLGHYTNIRRIPLITLSSQNSEFENTYTCGHELGHHYCDHGNNTEWLSRQNLKFNTWGSEYEANLFMVNIMLADVDLSEFETKEQLLKTYGIPLWASRYVDLLK